MAEATLLIERSPGETRAALLNGDAVVQVDHYRDHVPPLSGAVFHARVRRVEPGISAAFVDLDGVHEGFLRARAVAGRAKGAPIASLVQEGAAILVRVLDEASGDAGKLPRVATLDTAAVAALREAGPFPAAPACVDAGPPPVARILAEHGGSADIVVCNDGAVARAVRQWIATNDSGVPDDRCVVEQRTGDLFEPYGVAAAIEAALAPVVDLPGGGSLIFEPGTTLCAIDVNSGGRVASAGLAARDTNLAAVDEIARQLRLRAIAGTIVIDMLKMDRAADRDAVLAALRNALANDPASCRVLGLTRLGLVEATRPRRGPSLAARLLQPAAAPLPRPDATACSLLRDIAGRSRRGAARFVVHAAPSIIDLLRGPMAAALAESVAWSHAGIALTVDTTLLEGAYVIEEPAALDGRGGTP